MASDKRIGSNIPSFHNRDKVVGAKRDTSTLIGIVKNNVDPIRAGRLQVFVPNFGGDENEPSHWIIVGYANPYMGAARTPSVDTKRVPDNTYETSNHSYGMWFTPPDIGNHVLITFIDGDINHGYWFACVMPDLGHWAIPGQAGAYNVESPVDADLASVLKHPPYPTVEFNETNDQLMANRSEFLQINKPVHVEQTAVLLKQGLEDDKVRGVISSSSQRESPSKVFGISTPGRDGPAKDPVTSQVTTRKGGHTFVMDDGDKDGIDQLIRLRSAGGHQILLNDHEEIMYIGNKNGTVWLEFTGAGEVNWYSESDINIRSKANINFHADKSINMHAGDTIQQFAGTLIKAQSQTINLNATTDLLMFGQQAELGSGSTLTMSSATTGTFNAGTDLSFSATNNGGFNAGADLKLSATGIGSFNAGGDLVYSSGGNGSFAAGSDLILSGSQLLLNTSVGPTAPTAPTAPNVTAPTPIPVVKHKEAVNKPVGKYNKWTATGTVSSTIPAGNPVPTHEPYALHPSGPNKLKATGRVTRTPNSPMPVVSRPIVAAPSVSTQPTAIVQPATSQVGPVNASTKGTHNRQMALSDLAKQPVSTHGIGPLTAAEVTALKAQLAKSESNFSYEAVNQLSYIGKYQFGFPVMIDLGYITKDTTRNSQMVDPKHWTGKDGLAYPAAFFQAHSLQETMMDRLLASNYQALLRNHSLTADSPHADVAGKLAVSHLLGAGGCHKWTVSGSGGDANGVTGDIYYNIGVYAITVIAPKVG